MLAARQQAEIERQKEEILCLDAKVCEMTPKANYYDLILKSPESLVVTQIAKDYGMSPQEFDKTLRALDIQYKVNGQWVLYAKHQGEGYTDSTTGFKHNSGKTWTSTVRTQKGRLFLYNMLKQADVLPMIERPDGYKMPKLYKKSDRDGICR